MYIIVAQQRLLWGMRRERCAQSRTVRSDGKGVATWSEVAYQIDTDDFDCETTFCVVNRSTFQSSIIGKAVIVTRSLIKPPGENKPFQLRVEHRGQSDMTLNITLSSTDALPSKAKLRVKFSMANLWGAGMLQQLLSIKQPEPDPIKDHRGATLAFVMRRRQLDADHPPACHVVLASTKQYLGSQPPSPLLHTPPHPTSSQCTPPNTACCCALNSVPCVA
mmetsp:Transcript_8098/g.19270  ORF Transcript_8098/g.19270 Transcript_8098/m.19270 type:complete len:220 (-) Transcript_8098:32-691(-)